MPWCLKFQTEPLPESSCACRFRRETRRPPRRGRHAAPHGPASPNDQARVEYRREGKQAYGTTLALICQGKGAVCDTYPWQMAGWAGLQGMEQGDGAMRRCLRTLTRVVRRWLTTVMLVMWLAGLASATQAATLVDLGEFFPRGITDEGVLVGSLRVASEFHPARGVAGDIIDLGSTFLQ